MVGRLAEIIALEHGVNITVARQIRTAAALHDIGKQKIPGSILNKPGKLNASEFEIMKTHTVLGAEMLSDMQGELGEMARMSCKYHHEWHDGEGYWGKRSGELPFYVPYIAIADVFTALINERSYKQAWPPKVAMNYIHNQAGTQFDLELVMAFASLIRNNGNVSAIFMGR